VTKKPSPKLPRWECRDETDQKRFTQWSLEQLEALWAEYEAEGPDDHEIWLSEHPEAMEAMNRAFNEGLRRRRRLFQIDNAIDQAKKAKDFGPLSALGKKHPRLWQLICEQLFDRAYCRGRGRRKGEPRPTDRDPELLDSLQDAKDDIERLKWIWKKHYNKVNRGERNKPEAIDIVLVKHSWLKRKQLVRYLRE
jgi:hypothetical protein